MDRALASGAKGRRFESYIAHQRFQGLRCKNLSPFSFGHFAPHRIPHLRDKSPTLWQCGKRSDHVAITAKMSAIEKYFLPGENKYFMQHVAHVHGLCPAKPYPSPLLLPRGARPCPNTPFIFAALITNPTRSVLPNYDIVRYILVMNLFKKLKRENKPWAVLGMSRREYEAKRPWKVAGVSRDHFEEITVMVPAEIIERLKEEAQAELLVEQIFGKDVFKE